MATLRRSLRIGFAAGILIGLIFGLRRTMKLRRQAMTSVSPDPWTPLDPRPVGPEASGVRDQVDRDSQPEPAEAEAAPAEAEAPPAEADAEAAPAEAEAAPAEADAAPAGEQNWAEPVDGACPAGHPVKAKNGSGIFHLPGMLAYDRTKPDRCYRNEADAAADGFTKAKR